MTIKQYVLDALGKFWTKLKSTYVTNCASTSNNLALAASQGKVLQDQITALNSRLVTMPMPLISGLTTEELINTAYSDAHSNVINQTHYRRLLDHGMTHSVLGGGRYLLEGYRENAAYGWQITTSYALGAGTQPNKCFERSLINGTWSTWEKRPTRTEVDALNSKIAPVIALTYDSSISRFVPPSGTAKLANAQLTFVARNTNTGAIYVLYYIYSDNNFAVAATISGSAPSNGNLVQIMAVR